MRRKIQLYIISLWFLFFILFWIKIDVPICFGENCEFVGFPELIRKNDVPVVSLLLLFVGAFLYLNFNHDVETGAPITPKRITKIENINSETLSFLASYIIPLACLDMDKSRSLLLLFLLLILIGWIYVRTNLFYTNPTLAIMGFKVYKIDTANSVGLIVISKQSLVVNDWILPRKVNEGIYFAKKRNHDAT